ncbi:MAG: hypothetical protein GF308_12835 [Candidatus Heimdallarchaeota archaeon]|nr:hypothetical protein [Candidatus Heimdallarchaeota archaeon]
MAIGIRTIVIGFTVGFFAILIDILLLRKYQQRKKSATLTLTAAIFSFGLAAISLAVFALLTELKVSKYGLNFVGINIGYIFTMVADIAIFNFTLQIFVPRDKWIKLVYSICGGVVIGLILPDVVPLSSGGFQDEELLREIIESETNLWKLIILLVLTFIAFTTLLVFALRETRKADLTWEKRGFQFIALFAFVGILVYLFLVLDSFLDQILIKKTQILYHVGLSLTVVDFIFAYLGYIYPPWLRNLFREKPSNSL